MRVLVTGSSGLIGSALVGALERDGCSTVRLVRRAAERDGEVQWDPSAGTIDADALGAAGLDAAVHLAGEGIGTKRWSDSQKNKILVSNLFNDVWCSHHKKSLVFFHVFVQVIRYIQSTGKKEKTRRQKQQDVSA